MRKNPNAPHCDKGEGAGGCLGMALIGFTREWRLIKMTGVENRCDLIALPSGYRTYRYGVCHGN